MTVAVVVAACGGTPAPGAQTSPSTGPKADIKVGLAISLTGAANIYGPGQQNGAKLAMEQINSAGGINGAKIALVVEDDASARDQGITVFRKLINEDKVAAILGPTLSGVAAGAHPVAQQAGVPVIAISNTGVGIVGKCDYGEGEAQLEEGRAHVRERPEVRRGRRGDLQEGGGRKRHHDRSDHPVQDRGRRLLGVRDTGEGRRP
jgi:hypothetical protein